MFENVECSVYGFFFSDDISGPMTILQRAVMEKLRVRVWTRSAVHVRGICTGFIVVFDKHWNLVSDRISFSVNAFINPPQWTHDATMTSWLLQNDVTTLFCRNSDIIFALCVRWVWCWNSYVLRATDAMASCVTRTSVVMETGSSLFK